MPGTLASVGRDPGRRVVARGGLGGYFYRLEGRRGGWWPVLPLMATEVIAYVWPQGGDKEGERRRLTCWRHSGARGTLQRAD